MQFLPVALNLAHRNILFVGGGSVACHKYASLRRYGLPVTVAAPRICDELRRDSRVTCIQTPFSPRLLDSFSLVYACTNDSVVNREVHRHCKQRHILVNVADNPALCDFVSPAIYKNDHMSVAVSSNARDVRKAIAWRDRIRNLFESDV
jgi:siroheme synthase-like protein